MSNCGSCLYQGDRSADQKGNCTIFCLVKANWFGEDKKCEIFRDYADLSKDIRVRLAAEVRQEQSEDRRLKKLTQTNIKFVLVTLVASFILFWATVKLFDKYIF